MRGENTHKEVEPREENGVDRKFFLRSQFNWPGNWMEVGTSLMEADTR